MTDYLVYSMPGQMHLLSAGCLSAPHFSPESHETCENVVRNSKSARKWHLEKRTPMGFSYAPAKWRSAFGFFWVRSPRCGFWKEDDVWERILKSFFSFPAHALSTCFLFLLFLCDREEKNNKNKQQNKKKKQKKDKKNIKRRSRRNIREDK